MKKFLTLVFLLFSLSITCAFAATTVEFTVDSTEYSVLKTEAEKSSLEAAPYIKNSRTMAPVRAISEAFGAVVNWDDSTKTVFISNENTDVSIAIGSDKIKVNGEEKLIDSPAEIVNGTTFIPLRAITEVLGYYVYYVDATRQILIDDIPPIFVVNGVGVPYNMFRAFYTYNTNLDEETGLPIRDEYLSLEVYDFLVPIFTMYSNAQGSIPTLSEEAKSEISTEAANLVSSNERGRFVLSGSLALYFEKYLTSQEFSNMIMESYMASASDEAARKYYNANFVRAKHVLISTATRTDEEALAIANTVYEKASAGESFDNLISQYGEDPGAAQYPDGYVFTRGEMIKPFEDMAFSMNVRTISKPVKTDYGYHVIAKYDLFETPEILDALKSMVVEAEFDKYQESLIENAEILTNITFSEVLYI